MASPPVDDAAAAPLGCSWGDPVVESGLRSGRCVAAALCLPSAVEWEACSGHLGLSHTPDVQMPDHGVHMTAEAKRAHVCFNLHHAQLTLSWWSIWRCGWLGDARIGSLLSATETTCCYTSLISRRVALSRRSPQVVAHPVGCRLHRRPDHSTLVLRAPCWCSI